MTTHFLKHRLFFKGCRFVRDKERDLIGSGRAWELLDVDGKFICLVWEDEIIHEK